MQQPKIGIKTIPNIDQFSKELIQKWRKIVCDCIGNENITLAACTTTMRVQKNDILKVFDYEADIIDMLIDELCKKNYLSRIGSNIKLSKLAIEEFMEINSKKETVQSTLPTIKNESINNGIDNVRAIAEKQDALPIKNVPKTTKPKTDLMSDDDAATLKLLKNRKKSSAKKPITQPIEKPTVKPTEKSISPKSAAKSPMKPVDQSTNKNKPLSDVKKNEIQERIIEVTRSEAFMKMIQVAEEVSNNCDGNEMKTETILVECKKRMPEFADAFFREFFHLSPFPEIMKMEPENWKRVNKDH